MRDRITVLIHNFRQTDYHLDNSMAIWFYAKCLKKKSDNLAKEYNQDFANEESKLSVLLQEIQAGPVILSETNFVFTNSKPSGPWKVLLPKSDENYKVLQTDEEKEKFGSIVQSTLISNPTTGISYVTILPSPNSSPSVSQGTKIGSFELIKGPYQEFGTICGATHKLIASQNVNFGIGESKIVPCVLSENFKVNKPVCVSEYHGVNISSYLPSLSVQSKDLRTVLMTEQSIVFKNIHTSSISIEAGQKIAYAHCFHGHYEDSFCFKSGTISHPVSQTKVL